MKYRNTLPMKKNAVRFAYFLFDFILFTCLRSLLQLNWKIIEIIKNNCNISSILQPMKNDVRIQYVPLKNVWFCSFPMFGFTLVIKLRNSDFDSHWITLILFYQKHDVRFEYVLSNIWFCFSLFELNFGNKLRNTTSYFSKII